jgi:hypothetical protein
MLLQRTSTLIINYDKFNEENKIIITIVIITYLPQPNENLSLQI